MSLFRGNIKLTFFFVKLGPGASFCTSYDFWFFGTTFLWQKSTQKTSKIYSTGLVLVVLVCLICWISGDRQEKNNIPIPGVRDFSLDLRDQLVIQLVY